MENIIISIITGVVSIITCIVSNNTSKKVETTSEQQKNALKCIMRNDICTLYYNNKSNQTLKEHERTSLDKLYEGYKDMDGNSFVEDIYKEMRTWEVNR